MYLVLSLWKHAASGSVNLTEKKSLTDPVLMYTKYYKCSQFELQDEGEKIQVKEEKIHIIKANIYKTNIQGMLVYIHCI